jgi:hypothetical protein
MGEERIRIGEAWLIACGAPWGIPLYNIEYLGVLVLKEAETFAYVERYYWNEFAID